MRSKESVAVLFLLAGGCGLTTVSGSRERPAESPDSGGIIYFDPDTGSAADDAVKVEEVGPDVVESDASVADVVSEEDVEVDGGVDIADVVDASEGEVVYDSSPVIDEGAADACERVDPRVPTYDPSSPSAAPNRYFLWFYFPTGVWPLEYRLSRLGWHGSYAYEIPFIHGDVRAHSEEYRCRSREDYGMILRVVTDFPPDAARQLRGSILIRDWTGAEREIGLLDARFGPRFSLFVTQEPTSSESRRVETVTPGFHFTDGTLRFDVVSFVPDNRPPTTAISYAMELRGDTEWVVTRAEFVYYVFHPRHRVTPDMSFLYAAPPFLRGYPLEERDVVPITWNTSFRDGEPVVFNTQLQIHSVITGVTRVTRSAYPTPEGCQRFGTLSVRELATGRPVEIEVIQDSAPDSLFGDLPRCLIHVVGRPCLFGYDLDEAGRCVVR